MRGLQGFINSVFKLTQLPLSCPHYSCISKRAKMVNVTFKTKTPGIILHLAVGSTGPKSKVKANGK
ncbi:Mobile element protein [Candidatus Enterovibrio altilux]|uniref:Mobile element protein n=1 Tax=Candidatus Enterovibrio altilux TaxID=1927128 RepID=A0A291BBK1_9GAMM|nr:Mobile element protein [Candidatus Enterovibrio luxaltus]